jgi:hypothetical protein
MGCDCEECRVVFTSFQTQLTELARLVSDHSQRFDTLQTPWWKRAWFWLDGWPLYDLNAPHRRWRPWH